MFAICRTLHHPRHQYHPRCDMPKCPSAQTLCPKSSVMAATRLRAHDSTLRTVAVGTYRDVLAEVRPVTRDWRDRADGGGRGCSATWAGQFVAAI